MSTLDPSGRPITQKEAESYIPDLDEAVGISDYIVELRQRRARLRPEEESNLLVVGETGTGKTRLILGYLRERLNDPRLGRRNSDWSLNTNRVFLFIRINGGTIGRSHLENEIEIATHANDAQHVFVLLDEADQAFERGLDKPLRHLLDHPSVTTYATAESFEGFRRQEAETRRDDRLRAFLRRFPVRRRTANPEPEELYTFLVARISAWGLRADSDQTIRLLVRKSGCVVGYALGALIEAIEQERTLSFDLVSRYDPDPLVI
jgi:hypothetical protein